MMADPVLYESEWRKIVRDLWANLEAYEKHVRDQEGRHGPAYAVYGAGDRGGGGGSPSGEGERLLADPQGQGLAPAQGSQQEAPVPGGGTAPPPAQASAPNRSRHPASHPVAPLRPAVPPSQDMVLKAAIAKATYEVWVEWEGPRGAALWEEVSQRVRNMHWRLADRVAEVLEAHGYA